MSMHSGLDEVTRGNSKRADITLCLFYYRIRIGLLNKEPIEYQFYGRATHGTSHWLSLVLHIHV